MRVVCVTNKMDDITDAEVRRAINRSVHLSELNVVVGQEYCVYGISFHDGLAWYLICDEPDAEYPTPYCSAFFKLIDGTIPQGWEFTPMSANLGSPALLPEEWARDGHFLEPLVDEELSATRLFKEIKRRYSAL